MDLSPTGGGRWVTTAFDRGQSTTQIWSSANAESAEIEPDNWRSRHVGLTANVAERHHDSPHHGDGSCVPADGPEGAVRCPGRIGLDP